MAINECAVCTDPCVRVAAANSELSFRHALLSVLCQFYQSEAEVGVDGAVVILPQVSKTAAELNTSYATYANTGLLDTSRELKHIRVVNDSDADLEFSTNAGVTTHFIVPAYAVYDRSLGNFVAAGQTSLHMRIASGSAASTGSVKLEGQH